MENILSYLLVHGGSSVRYRVRREILLDESTNNEISWLQEKILKKSKVQKVLRAKQPDGWIGNELHGGPGKGLDSSISFLLNHGIEKDNEIMKNAIVALLDVKSEKKYRTTFKGGDALDAGGRGGNRSVKAGILAELGIEENNIVSDEIEIAISYLKNSLKYSSVDDFTEINSKGIRYYKERVCFPGNNHLCLLAMTYNWRTKENLKMVTNSINHCFMLMKDHSSNITFKSGNHFVGPFNFNWHIGDFKITDVNTDSYAFVWWIRSLYRLATFGVINDIPELKRAYDYLFELIKSGDVIYKQTEASLKRFKDILSVEDNWRKSESIYCDILFFSAITLFNAGYDIKKINVEF